MANIIKSRKREHMNWCYQMARRVLLERSGENELPAMADIEALANTIWTWTLTDGTQNPNWDMDVTARQRALVEGLANVTHRMAPGQYPTNPQIIAEANAIVTLLRSKD